MSHLLILAIGATFGSIATLALVFFAVSCLDRYFDYR